MDTQRIHAYKTRAIKKHKGNQLLNDLLLYSLTTLACTSFCSSPLWYPPFCATFNVFFLFSIHKITSFFFTSKALFIVCNLIIIFLLGQSKFFDSKYACKRVDQLQESAKTIEDTPKHETRMRVKTLDQSRTFERNEEEEFFEVSSNKETCDHSDFDDRMEGSVGCDEEDLSCFEQRGDVNLPVEELNKLVDDFIARINRQRRLEAEFCRV